jgi:predicted RNA-binding Zn ribbon-like protein
MSDASRRITDLKRIGGALCLDFANTTGWRPEPGDEERLRDYEDLVVWAERGGILTSIESRGLRRLGAADADKASAVHLRAVALREAVYRIFSAVADGAPVGADDVALLNREVNATLRHLRLAPLGDGFAWAWPREGSLELPLWEVARSAAELLVSPDLARVRECSGERCDWLFLDKSKNRSRRWCDMANCGNRAKAKRNYARRKGLEAGPAARGVGT